MRKVFPMDIHSIYPRWNEKKAYYQNRMQTVRQRFAEIFPESGMPRLFSAPGRTEIGGNHTDHQHGCVLAAAVDMDILGAAAPNGSDLIRVHSEGYPMVEVNVSALGAVKEEENTSASLIRGIAARMTEMGYRVQGFDAYLISDVLNGSGLSSSAAYEIWIASALNGLFCESKIDAATKAQIAQYAENVYFGKPSGLMDQMASAQGGVVAIDFADNDNPVIRRIDVDFAGAGYALCIIDSGADHADLTAEYAAIPVEMRKVAAFFGKQFLRDCKKQALIDNFSAVREAAGDRAVLRALHFFEDNERAQREARQLEQGDFAGFLATLNASGLSSMNLLQNVNVCGSTTEQAMAVTLAVCDLLLQDRGGARVHGGGFAGTVQAFVPLDMLTAFRAGIINMLGANRLHEVYVRPAGGTEITE